MIEASEQLARMLRFKQKHPEEYEAKLREIHESYCKNWKRD